MTLEEFWPFYVAQHLNPVNRMFHFAGTTFGLICLAAALATFRAGFPAATVNGGMSFITTAPDEITLPSPIVTPHGAGAGALLRF